MIGPDELLNFSRSDKNIQEIAFPLRELASIWREEREELEALREELRVNEPHYHGSGVHREGHQRWHETQPVRARHREFDPVWSSITWGEWDPS